MQFRLSFLFALALLGCNHSSNSDPDPSVSANGVHFVFIGDPHYGETRHFREDGNVSADVVNAALVSKLNTLSMVVLPDDGGVGANDTVGPIDFVVIVGDLLDKSVLSRGDDSIEVQWKLFADNYLKSIVLQGKNGEKEPIRLVAGNHDVPNSFVMSEIYNRSMQPATPVTKDSYEYGTMRIHYSFDWSGTHIAVLNIWPDSTELAWLEKDLAQIDAGMPVFLIAHDPPKVESTHFSNPAGEMPGTSDPFDNLLDPYKDGALPGVSAPIEERTFTKFLQSHPSVKAYFHGHNNYQEFYTYRGPDNNVELPVFRVDSPMKGQVSEISEDRLSFQVVTMDTLSRQITVRECLWNSNPSNAWEPIRWGQTITIPLR